MLKMLAGINVVLSLRQYIPRSSHSDAWIGTILKVDFRYTGSFVESAKKGHCIINGGIVDGEFFLGNEVVNAMTLWC